MFGAITPVTRAPVHEQSTLAGGQPVRRAERCGTISTLAPIRSQMANPDQSPSTAIFEPVVVVVTTVDISRTGIPRIGPPRPLGHQRRQDPVGSAPAVVVVAAARDRTRRKYGARAGAFVEREAGHAAQNILLEATAHQLASVPIGSLDPSRAATTLALPADQTVLYLIPVGLVG